jgi:hypothetical protein
MISNAGKVDLYKIFCKRLRKVARPFLLPSEQLSFILDLAHLDGSPGCATLRTLFFLPNGQPTRDLDWRSGVCKFARGQGRGSLR